MYNKPLISIGLPVFNGELFLSEAIESIFAQTFGDFELIISDNASTDRTEEICRSYSKKDERIHYVKNAINHGATFNFNKAFELSTGDYFKWASYDDKLHKRYLELCLDVLENDKSIVLCHSKNYRINEKSEIIGTYYQPSKWSSNRVHERFHDAILAKHACLEVFGVIRSHILRQTKLIGSYVSSDRNLLAELALRGRIFTIPEYLFFRRHHTNTSLQQYPNGRERAAWFDPNNINKITLPRWRLLIEYFRSLKSSKISFLQKGLCFITLIKWIINEWRSLASDIKYWVLNRTG